MRFSVLLAFAFVIFCAVSARLEISEDDSAEPVRAPQLGVNTLRAFRHNAKPCFRRTLKTLPEHK